MALRLWLGFPKSLDISKAIDKKLGAERKVVGYTKGRSSPIHGGGQSVGKDDPVTIPATPEAKQWAGWGTALKPAHEPIIVARKPLDGTVADNVERWGTGALNIDGCRIATEDSLDRPNGKQVGVTWDLTNRPKDYIGSEAGRFPANCVTTEPGAFFSKYFNVTPPELCKKASKRDRDSDWRGEEIALEEKRAGGMQATVDGSMLTGSGNERKTVYRNTHPTVKPTNLMAWLVRLVTPPGGIVLDPFVGSGSTCVAARREGFLFIGIELNEEYVEMARRRVASHTAQQELKFA